MENSVITETEYLMRRAATQLVMAGKAVNRDVAVVHYRLSSLYLERAKALIDAQCLTQRRRPILFAVR